ncbi:MAG: 30S ribosomal protein S2 [Patescibacteria group bacterium]
MTNENKKTIVSEELAKEMFSAGVHFGHKKGNHHPKMDPYIHGIKNNIQIINLEETMKGLEKALDFIEEIIKNSGKILFVGVRPQSQLILKETAERCKMPYVSLRWIGGLLTNFRTIRKRIDHFIGLEKKREEGELKKYTKKEQKAFDKEIDKLNKNFGGLKSLDKLPDAIFVLGVKDHLTAIREAKIKKIPVISLVDTDSNPALVDYIIPANDEAVSALQFMLNQVEKVIIPA